MEESIQDMLTLIETAKKKQVEWNEHKQTLDQQLSVLNEKLHEKMRPVYIVKGKVSNHLRTRSYKKIVGYFSTFAQAWHVSKNCKNVHSIKIIAVAKVEVIYNNKLKLDGLIDDNGYCSD